VGDRLSRIIGIDLTGDRFRAGWMRSAETQAIDVLAQPPQAIVGVNRDGRLVAGEMAKADGVTRFGPILAPVDDSEDAAAPFVAGSATFRSEAVWAIALAAVRDAVERQTRISVTQCVVAGPAEMLRRDAERMKRAGVLAGMPVLRIVPATILTAFNAKLLRQKPSVRLAVVNFENIGASACLCEGGDEVLEHLGEIRIASGDPDLVVKAVEKLVAGSYYAISRLAVRGDAARANAFAAVARQRLSKIPDVETDTDPDAAAKGAGLQAAVLQGDVRESILLGAYPGRIGYERSGKLVPIVDDATTTPTRKSVVLRSKRPGGDLTVRLRESSASRPEICSKGLLGEFTSLPPEGAGENSHEITVLVDTDHALQISCVAERERDGTTVKGAQADWVPINPPVFSEDQYAVLRGIELLLKSATTGGRQFDYFISHSSVEAAHAHKLVERLEAAGKNCWIAPRNVADGKDFATEIMTGLKSSRELVLMFSANAARSRHVLREFLFMAEANRRIFPVMMDGAELVDQYEYYLVGVQRIASSTPHDDAERILRSQ
jgi:molecular chaperone DnaK (HSP70)